MYRPDLCKALIELILNVKVKEIRSVDGQKTLEPNYDSHGVRLDVYVDDDLGTVYDLEMQTTISRSLAKRTRFYQSAIDMDILEKGEPYFNLKKSYVIFFCTEDAFGMHYPIYSFENLCVTDPYLRLGDDAFKIIINPDSDRTGLNPELNSLLDLLQGKQELMGLAKEISDAIIEEKRINKWRDAYMKFDVKLMDEHEAGRIEEIYISVQDGDYSPARGAEKLGISEDELLNDMIKAGFKIPESV